MFKTDFLDIPPLASVGGVVRLPGRISWVSSEAEFTPKIIQTKEERVDMVYAFKVRVPDREGMLKNGMPGEVFLNGTAQ